MNPNHIEFFEEHRLFWRLIRALYSLPIAASLKLKCAKAISKKFSPWSYDCRTVKRLFQTTLGLDEAAAQLQVERWAEGHGEFALLAFNYANLGPQWLEQYVTIENPQLFNQLCDSGGIILTYHTYHHNTLFAVMGLLGARVYPVVAPDKNAIDSAYVGRYMQMINQNSAQHFNAGHYLFTDDKEALNQGVAQSLESKACLGVLCDNWTPRTSMEPLKIFDRQIQVGRGVLRMAKSHGPSPVYAAIMHRELAGGYRIAIQALGALEDESVILQRYFNYLEDEIKQRPWLWQGWAWFDPLPHAA